MLGHQQGYLMRLWSVILWASSVGFFCEFEDRTLYFVKFEQSDVRDVRMPVSAVGF